MLNINEENLNTIPKMFNLLYQKGSYEFLSELIYYSKFYYFKNENLRKKAVISILIFAISSRKIIVEEVGENNKTSKIYNHSNYRELIEIVKNKWEQFKDHDGALLWYSYQLNYSKRWEAQLK